MMIAFTEENPQWPETTHLMNQSLFGKSQDNFQVVHSATLKKNQNSRSSNLFLTLSFSLVRMVVTISQSVSSSFTIPNMCVFNWLSWKEARNIKRDLSQSTGTLYPVCALQSQSGIPDYWSSRSWFNLQSWLWLDNCIDTTRLRIMWTNKSLESSQAQQHLLVRNPLLSPGALVEQAKHWATWLSITVLWL